MAAKPTDEVFLPPNRSQFVCRKYYNEWNGSAGTSTPTKIKEYADEIFLSLVGENIIFPPKQPPTETNRSVDDKPFLYQP